MRKRIPAIAFVLVFAFVLAAALTDGFGGALERWLLALHGVHR